MKNHIINIKLENDYIIVTYKNQSKEKVIFNKKNKECYINYLKEEKKISFKRKKESIRKIFRYSSFKYYFFYNDCFILHIL